MLDLGDELAQLGYQVVDWDHFCEPIRWLQADRAFKRQHETTASYRKARHQRTFKDRAPLRVPTCSRCGKLGHNKRTCSVTLPAIPVPTVAVLRNHEHSSQNRTMAYPRRR